MKRISILAVVLALALQALPAAGQDKLVVSIWGGSWRDLVADTAAKKFTQETGVAVDFITGGTIDRLNKAKLAKGSPESDLNFTTAHVGWLYANDDLYEPLDLSKVPNAANLVDQAKISPYHVGTWAYVYTIGYRPDLIKDVTFESWADLWKPEVKGKLAAPDFDPSHLVVVSAILSGADAASWQKGEERLKALKPSFKAFYTNDANSQQLIANGETPVQVILSMNAHYMAGQGVPIKLVIPKEGAVLGIDTIAIMKAPNTSIWPTSLSTPCSIRPFRPRWPSSKRAARWWETPRLIRRSPSSPACSPRPISGRPKPSSSTTNCALKRRRSGASGSPRTS